MFNFRMGFGILLAIILAGLIYRAAIPIKADSEAAPPKTIEAHQKITANRELAKLGRSDSRYNSGTPPRRESEEILNNTSLNGSNGRLQKAYEKALESRNPQEISKYLRISTRCQSISSAPLLEATVENLRVFNGKNQKNDFLILRESISAREQFLSNCKSGDSDFFQKQLNSSTLSTVGPVHRALVSSNPDQPRQEYFQAVTQILSNPTIFPGEFDAWLDHGLKKQLNNEFGLDSLQTEYVQDQIYELFAGKDEISESRQLLRCALAFRCPNSMVFSPSEKERIDAAITVIESRIRQQRWDQLVVKK